MAQRIEQKLGHDALVALVTQDHPALIETYRKLGPVTETKGGWERPKALANPLADQSESRLEGEPHRELQDARIVSAADLPEGAAGHCQVRVFELGNVENIERLEAEFHHRAFLDQRR
jgi:hypothetical protein